MRWAPWLLAVGLLACPRSADPPAGRCDGVRCTGTELCNPLTGRCEPRTVELPDGGDGGLDGGDAGGADAGADAGPDGGSGDPDGGWDGGGDGGDDAGVDGGVDAGPGCHGDGDCFGATAHCRLATGACVECLDHAHCTTSVAPRCDPVALACVECLSNVDCVDPTAPVCGELQQCVGCESSAQCGAGRECDLFGRCRTLPDACGAPRLLAFPGGVGMVSFSADPSLALDDATSGCGGSGPELVYQLSTTGVRGLDVSVATLGGAPRPVVYLRAAPCGTGAELACDAPDAGAAALSVSSLPPGDHFLFVETTGGAPGRVTVTVSLSVPSQPLNDSCAAPADLVFSGTTATAVGTTLQASDDSADAGGPSCSATAAAGGADLVYRYTVAAPSNVTVTARPLVGSALHPVVSVRSSCGGAASERGCVASTVGQAVQLSFPAQDAGTSYLWLDSADGTTGAFQLEVTAVPVVVNDTCAGAEPLSFSGASAIALGDTGSASNGNASGDSTPSCSTSAWSSGHDLVFSYTLTQARDVTVSATPTGLAPTFEPVVYVRSACADASPGAELACVSPLAPQPATATLLNQPAGTYFVWVDSARDTTGPFQLEVVQAAPTPPPANDTCAGAVALSFTGDRATVSGTTRQAGNDGSGWDLLPTCSAQARQSGRDVVYAFTLTQPKDVQVTVTPAAATTPLNPVLSVRRSACDSQFLRDELVCLARAGPASATLTSLPAGPYWIWVDGAGGTAGDFTLDVALAAPTPAPANDGCAGATPLGFVNGVAVATGTTVGATNSNDVSDNAPGCGDGFLPKRYGRDLVYTYELTGARDVEIVAAPSAGSALVPVVYVRQPTFCTNGGAGFEVACLAARRSEPLTVFLPNQAAGVYSLFVDSNSYDTGPFTLTVTTRPPTTPPANDTCAGPVTLSPGVAVQGDTGPARDDYSSLTYGSACQRYFFTGRDVVYAFTAPSAGTYTATVTPQGAFDPALLLLTPTCGAAQCVRFSDGAAAGGAERVSFSAAAGSSWFLVVDSYERSEPNTWGAFSLVVQ